MSEEEEAGVRTLVGMQPVSEMDDSDELLPLHTQEIGAVSEPHRVLLVDDQRIVGAAVRRALADEFDLEFHHCLAAADLDAAIARVDPTVILQDLVMPDADGLDLLRTMRARPELDDVSILVLSSREAPETKAEAFQLGANDYIVKLPARQELVARIRHHSRSCIALRERTRYRRKLKTSLEELDRERQKSDALLQSILPRSVAARLKEGERNIADSFDRVSVLFADLVGFTPLARAADPSDLVAMLNRLFDAFDEVVKDHGAEKLKTIGDGYVAVSGLPDPNPEHAATLARVGIDLIDIVSRFTPGIGGSDASLQLRVGIHTGPVVAGVIGRSRFAYDIWGDTVNVASRMESHGLPGRVQVSRDTAVLLGGEFDLETRGPVPVKGRGEMEVFLVNRPLRSRSRHGQRPTSHPTLGIGW